MSAVHQLRYVASDPKAFLQHRRRSEVLISPGDAGFAGGVFNPGVVSVGDASDQVIGVAKGQHEHWIEANLRGSDQFLRGAPLLFTLDRTRREVVDLAKLEGAPSDGADVAWEDFRSFRRTSGSDVEVWASHSIIDIDPDTGLDRGSRIGLASIDRAERAVTALGQPEIDRSLAAYEKNWLFRERADGGLRLWYGVDPWIVLDSTAEEPLEFRTAAEAPSGLGDIGGFGTFTGFSAHPQPWDAGRLITLIHQVDPAGIGRRYLQWAVLIDEDTGTPLAVSREAVLDGHGARGRLKGALYAMSMLVDDEGVDVFCGEGDSFCSVIRIDRAALDEAWRPL